MALKRRGARPPFYRSHEARDFLASGQIVGVLKELAGDKVIRAATEEETLWVLSDASKDRYGDTVNAEGHVLEHYERNPVLLWAHDSDSPPIGRIPDVYVDGKGAEASLMGHMGADDWVPRDVQPFAWAVKEMVARGFLNAVSIGFLPIEFTFNEDWSMNFKAQELLEVSVVPVPANSNALAQARSASLWVPEIDAWLERKLDERKPGPTLEIARSMWSLTKRKAVPVHGRGPAVDADPDEPETDETAGDGLAEVRALTEAVEENTAVQRELLAEMRTDRAERKSATVSSERRDLITDVSEAVQRTVAGLLKK